MCVACILQAKETHRLNLEGPRSWCWFSSCWKIVIDWVVHANERLNLIQSDF